jgi:hypothetical protein
VIDDAERTGSDTAKPDGDTDRGPDRAACDSRACPEAPRLGYSFAAWDIGLGCDISERRLSFAEAPPERRPTRDAR